MKMVIAFLTLAIAAFIPTEALAWGPGVHMALGNSVLANLGCLPPLIGTMLAGHQNAFLYGCLSADIFIGKGTKVKPGHSHNWVTGFKLLSSAKDPRVIAYAYGYLTHLAADVVAHNYFVPNTLWTMPSGGKISHVYVEAQADREFKTEHKAALALFKRPNKDTDGSLLIAMDKKRLPFLVKKQIIKSTLKVCGTKEWGHSLRLADRLLPNAQNKRHLDEMYRLSQNLVFNFLADPRATVAVSFDPIGSGNLRSVRELCSRHRPRSSELAFVPPESITTLTSPLSVSVEKTAAIANG